MFSINTQYIIQHLLTYLSPRWLPVGVLFVLLGTGAFGQSPETKLQLSGNIPDTLTQPVDSMSLDTLQKKPAAKNPPLEAEVKYTADDSLSISLGTHQVFMYKNASVDYQDIKLKANYIDFSLDNNTVTAHGIPDSTGHLVGKPVFTQGSEEFDSDTIRYDFKTHKGIIKYIITKQGEGFLHSERTKRLADGEIHVSKGKYTTCDKPHPDFYIRLTKAIVIPNKKIVSGPAYLVLEDIPLPLAIPFGFFPNTTKRSSGLIIPTYGEEQTRGFYLRSGGWYFAVNDYLDLTMLGTLYSRGSWGLTGASVYNVRYRYNGRFSVEFNQNRVNDDPNYKPSRDFRIMWSHNQDPKANPNRSFRASVNFSSTKYEQNQANNISDYLTSTKTSSIAYSRTWPGSPFSLNANLQQSQNSQTHNISLTLPTLAFNMSRIYPFRSKNTTGKYNWFQNIQVSYNAKLENHISAPDTSFFTRQTLRTMRNGFYHSIPISLAGVKLFKIINIVPTVSYSGVMYTSYLNKKGAPDTAIFQSNKIEIDTIQRITYAHALSASLGISASPKIYGMFVSKNPNSYIAAIRHVMTPTASLSFSPDMSKIMPNYYRTLVTPASIIKPSQKSTYSIYDGYLYGTPTVNGRSGSLTLGLNNNLEMKVRERSDTAVTEKKVSLLDNLNFNTSYNPFKKTLKWSPVTMQGATTLFNKKLSLNFGATFNPYALDSLGNTVNRFLFRESGRLFRTTNAYFSMRFTLQSAAGDKSKTGTTGTQEAATPTDNPTLDMLDESTAYNTGSYVDFSIPWSLNVDYQWNYSKTGLKSRYTHTVRLSGSINLTSKWKIGLTSGYDFIAKKITTTNFSVHRDLHCWEMQFSVIPFGQRRSYSFTINAKASVLRDIKYNKSKSWQDYF